MPATREVEIEAPPEDVWEAIATDEGRERWLGGEEAATVEVIDADAPHRLVWRWAQDDAPPTTVEFRIVGVPAGTRVRVTESEPALPVAELAMCLSGVAA